MDTALASQARAAARLIAAADSLVITAGAGVGVDSGLPDFRGAQGFWKAYPALGREKIRFEEIANPYAFLGNPERAWGFYGHRLNLYRSTAPHDGYRVLRDIAGQCKGGAFVFTSNVDGHFAKAGFPPDRIIECHGSIHHLQCMGNCAGRIWDAAGFAPEVDEERCLLVSPLPRCPDCGGIARPNILMFGDSGWEDARTGAQETGFQKWLRMARYPVVVEIGAGTSVPTVRLFGASLRAPLIRINPDEPERGYPCEAYLRSGALAGIAALAEELTAMGFAGIDGQEVAGAGCKNRTCN